MKIAKMCIAIRCDLISKLTPQLNWQKKKIISNKYQELGSEYLFTSFGVETLGLWGPSALHLLNYNLLNIFVSFLAGELTDK